MKVFIQNADLINGKIDMVQAKVCIMIEDGIITKIGEFQESNEVFDKILDATGKTVLPGLINCHVHLCMNDGYAGLISRRESSSHLALRAAANCKRMLKNGFTTVRDMGSKEFEVIALRDSINNGITEGSRILAAGQAILMTGGHFVGMEADGKIECQKAARAQLKAGADFIKLMATGGIGKPGEAPGTPELTFEELLAGVEVAKMANKKSSAHAHGKEGIKNAIKAGVNSIEHGTLLDDEAISMMLDQNVHLVPTFSVYYRIATFGKEKGLPQHLIESCKRVMDDKLSGFQKAYHCGVKISFGTDGGAPLVSHEDVISEVISMKDAGMSPLDILKSLTSTAANLLGLEKDIGTLEPGKKADLIFLEGNPLQSLENFGKVLLVMKEGKVLS